MCGERLLRCAATESKGFGGQVLLTSMSDQRNSWSIMSSRGMKAGTSVLEMSFFPTTAPFEAAARSGADSRLGARLVEHTLWATLETGRAADATTMAFLDWEEPHTGLKAWRELRVLFWMVLSFIMVTDSALDQRKGPRVYGATDSLLPDEFSEGARGMYMDHFVEATLLCDQHSY
jgi:hypothetical protein